MSDVIIRAEGLGKQYRLGARAQYQTLRERITGLAAVPWRRLRHGRNLPPAAAGGDGTFWALKDVSFEVSRGEIVGIIGRNGAGKSTLLKILSRITEPTEGGADLKGRLGSLLEVGTGFHPELTGRENIYLNGAIFGMRREEIAARFDDIVAFAEVEKFIDTPVKYYSSGMFMRLGFAVAAHLEPAILVVDEVLAVGDAQFQKRCLGKLGEVAGGGRTVLFVSHNMATIRQLTNRCLYLRAGRLICADRTPAVTDRYLEDSVNVRQQQPLSLDYYRRGGTYESSVRFQALRFVTESGDEAAALRPGDTFRVEATITSGESHEQACVAFWLSNDRGERVSTFFSGDAGFRFAIVPGTQTVRCTVAGLPLSPGRYVATIGINRTAGTLAFDVLVDYPAFEVTLPELETGALDWAQRPWGCVHWTQVSWGG
jgi:lipopolysaccharide transport system ATP-binding protein